jgi:hypothetical protein
MSSAASDSSVCSIFQLRLCLGLPISFFLLRSKFHGAEPFLRSHQLISYSTISKRFMQTEGLFPYSQEPPLVPILSQMNPVHTIPTRFFFTMNNKCQVISYFHSRLVCVAAHDILLDMEGLVLRPHFCHQHTDVIREENSLSDVTRHTGIFK